MPRPHSECQQTSLFCFVFHRDAALPSGWCWVGSLGSFLPISRISMAHGLIGQLCRSPPCLLGSLQDCPFPGPSSVSRGRGLLRGSSACLCLLCSFTYSFSSPRPWKTQPLASWCFLLVTGDGQYTKQVRVYQKVTCAMGKKMREEGWECGIEGCCSKQGGQERPCGEGSIMAEGGKG